MIDSAAYILDKAGWLWLAGALLAAVLELVIPAFVFALLGIAAAVAALAAVFGAVFGAQLASFGVSALLLLLLLRPRILSRLHARNVIPSRTEILQGKLGVVTQALSPAHPGRVVVDGQDWAAAAEEPLVVGTTIEVTGADGIVLHVRRSAIPHTL